MEAEAPAPTARRLIDHERRVHRILRARFTDALLDLGVSFAQFEVMELLHEAHQLHPGAIGRQLLITRQSADHLVHQLRRGWLVETWRLDGGSLGVALTGEGRTRITQCLRALRPTFDLIETLDTGSGRVSARTCRRTRTPCDRSDASGGSTPSAPPPAPAAGSPAAPAGCSRSPPSNA